MPDVLVRGVSEDVKRKLALRAAKNGRSVQAETLDVLTRAVQPKSPSWYSMLRVALQGAEDDGFEVPARHTARDEDVW